MICARGDLRTGTPAGDLVSRLATAYGVAQQPSYGAQGEVPASAYSLANAASCTLTGAVWAPPG
jgi:hypothetical protein